MGRGIQGYALNEDFFKTWSRDSAWVYGWLLTDGGVYGDSGQITLGLKRTDDDVLKKIKEKLEFSGNIYEGEREDGRQYSTLRICRKSVAEDLFALGMARTDKTFNTELPKIPDSLYWDLMRGIFEGDGNLKHSTGNTDDLRITIYGATKQFILDLQTTLESRGVFTSFYTRKANSVSGNKREVYSMYTKSNADALRMAYFMYANTDENQRLNRKFDVFTNYARTYYDVVKRRSVPCIELVELIRQTIPECADDYETHSNILVKGAV